MTVTFEGHIRQLGFVVRDLDRALDHWVNHVGAGPFFRADVIKPDDFEHRGAPGSPTFTAALGNSGPIQIELLQLLDDVPSLWREFLDEGREGLQHVAYWTDDYDTAFQRTVDAGFTPAHRGSLTGGRFSYFESPTPGAYAVELSEQSPAKQRVFGAICDAAADWDHSDPIRTWDELLAIAHQS